MTLAILLYEIFQTTLHGGFKGIIVDIQFQYDALLLTDIVDLSMFVEDTKLLPIEKSKSFTFMLTILEWHFVVLSLFA